MGRRHAELSNIFQKKRLLDIHRKNRYQLSIWGSKMKKIFLILMMCSGWLSFSQLHEIGVFGGGSNYIGDVGNTTYINPSKFVGGVLYKWNVHERYSWRISLNQTQLSSFDSKSRLDYRKERQLSFENKITEASLGIEFNFWRFNLNQDGLLWSPYIFSGITYLKYDDLYYEQGNLTAKKYEYNTGFAIPVNLGIKMRIGWRVMLGAEISAKLTSTDNIDGSFSKFAAKNKAPNFGNNLSNDWYVFSGITLTYTFGRPPCYCP